MPPPLAVVIPCRNEASRLPALLASLFAEPSLVSQVVVVDGGSEDNSVRVAALAGATVLRSTPGRGKQLALGIAAVSEPWLLLLHCDVTLPLSWASRLHQAIACSDPLNGPAWWFSLAISGADPALRVVEIAVAIRSSLCQCPYGDQGLLLGRALLARIGGIQPLPVMEDLELAERLRTLTRLRGLGLPLRVSDRRWRLLGVWQTTLANARLRRDWRRGVSPVELAARYQAEMQDRRQQDP